MRVTLPPDVVKIVKKQIASGRFKTAAEVIRAGVESIPKQPLPDNFHTAAVQAKIQEGIDAFERGDYTSYDAEGLHQFMERIKKEGRKGLKTVKQAIRA